MRNGILLLILLLTGTMATAQRLSMVFDETPLPDALRQIDHAQTDRNIVFVMNDLEELRATCTLHRKDVLEAVQEVCKGFPILITETGSHIFVEYIRPPMHLLPSVTKIQKQIVLSAEGYWIKPNMYGISATKVLTILPRLSVRDGAIYLNGQALKNIFLNGMPLTETDELDQLASDMIETIRIDEHNNHLYITLRQPKEGGFYGHLQAQASWREETDEEGLSGVWYSRFRKNSIYDKFGWENEHQSDEIRQTALAPGVEKIYRTDLDSDQRRFANRFSFEHEYSPSQSLGFSYYVATRHGKGKSAQSDVQNFNSFSGKNQYTDQELTLRYHACFGKNPEPTGRNPEPTGIRQTEVNVIADIFSRQTETENLSLYGAGVGTEIGEAPSIVMTKLSADAQTSLSQQMTLFYGFDFRSYNSHYDPDKFLSNFQGISAFRQKMDLHGTLLRGDLELQYSLGRASLTAGISPQANRNHPQLSGSNLSEESPVDYRQFDWNPHFRTFIPFGDERQHNLSLSYRQELDEIPYSAMSPAIRWGDAYNYSTGNYNLRAPRSQLFQINSAFWQNRLIATLSYTQLKDEIYWQSFINHGQTEIFFTKPVNIGSSRRMQMQIEGNLQPADHWHTKLLASWNLRPEEETIGSIHYSDRHMQQYYSWVNHWEIDRRWQFHADVWYQPRYRIYDRTYHATGSLDAEVKRSFLSNRLECGVMLCLWGINRKLDRRISDYELRYDHLSSLRQIGIQIAWNFSSKQHVKVNTVEGGQQYKDINE